MNGKKNKKREKKQSNAIGDLSQEKILGRLRSAALDLLRDPHFLFRVGQQLEAKGVVGERTNRLILFLAAVTKDFGPVSVLVKGPTSSGKNQLVRAVVNLVPPECVVTRTSMTPKALAYGSQSLRGKILYLQEYRSGRDRNYLARLLQSEGGLAHEHTVSKGRDRTTNLAGRSGAPVIFSTTTDEKVYPDDETRFLSLRADESAELTRLVIRSKFHQPHVIAKSPAIEVWFEVFRLLAETKPVFVHPEWLLDLAEWIPSGETRARRDVGRFVNLLRAVALCRSFSDERLARFPTVEVTFADYCVAFELLGEAFTSTYRGAHPQALRVAEAVRRLHKFLRRPVKVKEVAEDLSWEPGLTYKWVKAAVGLTLVGYEHGTNENNTKPLVPGPSPSGGFLPHPLQVLKRNAQIGIVRYGNPLTGEPTELKPPRGAETTTPRDEQIQVNAYVAPVVDSPDLQVWVKTKIPGDGG
jgi:hypothetical protein